MHGTLWCVVHDRGDGELPMYTGKFSDACSRKVLQNRWQPLQRLGLACVTLQSSMHAFSYKQTCVVQAISMPNRKAIDNRHGYLEIGTAD